MKGLKILTIVKETLKDQNVSNTLSYETVKTLMCLIIYNDNLNKLICK